MATWPYTLKEQGHPYASRSQLIEILPRAPAEVDETCFVDAISKAVINRQWRWVNELSSRTVS